MQCPNEKEWISYLADEEMSESFSNHLKSCSMCRKKVQDYNLIVTRLKSIKLALPEEQEWHSIKEKVLESLSAEISFGSILRGLYDRFTFILRPAFGLGAVLAAFVLIAYFSFYHLNKSSEDSNLNLIPEISEVEYIKENISTDNVEKILGNETITLDKKKMLDFIEIEFSFNERLELMNDEEFNNIFNRNGGSI